MKLDLVCLLNSIGHFGGEIVLLLRHIHLLHNVTPDELIEQLEMILRGVFILASGMD